MKNYSRSDHTYRVDYHPISSYILLLRNKRIIYGTLCVELATDNTTEVLYMAREKVDYEVISKGSPNDS